MNPVRMRAKRPVGGRGLTGVNWGNAGPQEDFSSQGADDRPGRIKTGHQRARRDDEVSPLGTFFLARQLPAPHVSGAAALVLSGFPYYHGVGAPGCTHLFSHPDIGPAGDRHDLRRREARYFKTPRSNPQAPNSHRPVALAIYRFRARGARAAFGAG